MGQTALKAVINLVEISQCAKIAPVAETSRCRGVYDLVQLQRHIQENAKEQAHPEALSAMFRSTGTLGRYR